MLTLAWPDDNSLNKMELDFISQPSTISILPFFRITASETVVSSAVAGFKHMSYKIRKSPLTKHLNQEFPLTENNFICLFNY